MKRCAALVLLCSTAAAAHSTIPITTGVLLPPGSTRVYAATNFGLLASSDGASWNYVCETALGGQPVASYTLASDGALFAVGPAGIVSGPADACGFAVRPTTTLDELAADAQDPQRLYAVGRGPNGFLLLRSADGGRTVETAVDGSGTRFQSLVAGPPGIAAVARVRSPSGSDPGEVALLTTRDAGASWAAVKVFADTVHAVAPLALDADPASMWLAVTTFAPTSTAIARTSDGGRTLTTELEVPAAGAFLRSADGTILVAEQGRIHRRAPGAAAFESFAGPTLTCLAERAGRIYGCTDPITDGHSLAVSDDGGKTFKPFFHFRDLRGPSGCADYPSACASDWAALQRLIAQFDPPRSSGCATAGAAPALLLLLLLIRRRRAPWRRRRPAARR